MSLNQKLWGCHRREYGSQTQAESPLAPPCFLSVCGTTQTSLQSQCESPCSSPRHSSDSICRITCRAHQQHLHSNVKSFKYMMKLIWQNSEFSHFSNHIFYRFDPREKWTWETYFCTLGYCMSLMELVESLCLSFRWRGHMLSTQSIWSTCTHTYKIGGRKEDRQISYLLSFCFSKTTTY